MASKRSRSEMEEDECEKKHKAIALIRAATKAAMETVAKDEFGKIFAEAELIIARRLEKKKPRNRSGNEQGQSGTNGEGSSSIVQRGSEQSAQSGSSVAEQSMELQGSDNTSSAQRLPAWYEGNMSWPSKGRRRGPKPREKSQEEIETERHRIMTGIQRDFDWNPETNTWMQRGLVPNHVHTTVKPGSTAFRDAAARRHLEGWLSDDRGRAMWAYINSIRDAIPIDDPYRFSEMSPHRLSDLSPECMQTLRSACELLTNTSWELGELWNFMLLTRYYSGNKWGAARGFGSNEAERIKEYISLVRTIAEQKLIPHRPIPWRKFFYYEPPSMETLKGFGLVYHPCGLLVPDTFENGWYVPPIFRGEEHLAVVRFYKNGGIWLDRESMVAPIEAKPRYRSPGKKQGESLVVDTPFLASETALMREVQRAFAEGVMCGRRL
ncbi:hypothetical protein SBOR_9876 [Sclerotinia borealis F-4128]|uniref:Uncharacterized protein n=1 Tax=Sclerotinia borealis (strain F-4128) TaxID=1432307 RepID=W9C484_SCLBF|nr:hypothetical protein SBOR_9876 [Sclerotinia borealis F-4128]